MDDAAALNVLFHDAVSAIDSGDVAALERMLTAHPRLVRDRLDAPGEWLRNKIADALSGFFQRPYLLWFVAEDPVRNGKLPGNIGQVARTIIRTAEHERVESLQEQLDYALRLVCWSWIARECSVQIELIDVLLDAGASLDGLTVYEGRFGTNCDSAIYNRNYAAAEHLLKRGAAQTLTTALCLGHWGDAERLVAVATLAEKRDAFVQAALHGNAEALRRMLAFGLDSTTVSARNQSHGTALHHAVWSGSLDSVQVLVEAGADLHARDTVYNGTPLGWARHGDQEQSQKLPTKQYREIAAYLETQGGT